MRVLSTAIYVYVLGLLVFYVFAIFNTPAWGIVYFSWSKVADCGFLFWLALFYILPKERSVIKWLLYFSVVRLVWDFQSFFTGLGVNNESWMAILFLMLLILTCYLCLKPEGKAAQFLSKYLKI